MQVAADVDAAGHREQRRQQDDEGQVFGQRGMHDQRAAPAAAPKTTANGSRNASAQAAATLPKWWCQNGGASSGISAIDSSMPAKGTPHSRRQSAAVQHRRVTLHQAGCSIWNTWRR